MAVFLGEVPFQKLWETELPLKPVPQNSVYNLSEAKVTIKIKVTLDTQPHQRLSESHLTLRDNKTSDTSEEARHPTPSGPAEARGPESSQGHGQLGARPENVEAAQLQALGVPLPWPQHLATTVGPAEVTTSIMQVSWDLQLSILQGQGTQEPNGVTFIGNRGARNPEENLTWLAIGYDKNRKQYPSEQRSESQLRLTRHHPRASCFILPNFAQVPTGRHSSAV